jgi:hypothetical protein
MKKSATNVAMLKAATVALWAASQGIDYDVTSSVY